MSLTYMDNMNFFGDRNPSPPPPRERGCVIKNLYRDGSPVMWENVVYISLSFVSKLGCGGPTSHKVFFYIFVFEPLYVWESHTTVF